jgi:hypothetical protein
MNVRTKYIIRSQLVQERMMASYLIHIRMMASYLIHIRMVASYLIHIRMMASYLIHIRRSSNGCQTFHLDFLNVPRVMCLTIKGLILLEVGHDEWGGNDEYAYI